MNFISSRRSQVIGQFEDGQHVERMDTSGSNDPSAKTAQIQRQGRSERRYLDAKQVCYSVKSKQGFESAECNEIQIYFLRL